MMGLESTDDSISSSSSGIVFAVNDDGYYSLVDIISVIRGLFLIVIVIAVVIQDWWVPCGRQSLVGCYCTSWSGIRINN